MMTNTDNSHELENLRCAVYARYSSDLQRASSVDDQVRNCRKFAAEQGWTILEDYVRSDEAISGQTLNSRKALNSLVADAKRSPRPFDCLLIDDTSRFGRNLEDVLRLAKIINFHGVHLFFVSQKLDSQNPNFRIMLTLNGMVDEQYVAGLSDKVHRGQEGRLLAGFNPGGKCYGYRNVPVEDPTRRGEYGRAAIIGVKLVIVEEQARVVRRIFEMYDAGMGYAAIAKELNGQGIRSPQPPRKTSVRAWCPTGIRSMLLNEKYRGLPVWNRTRKARDPESGRKVRKPRPKAEHVRREFPELRIVSEELWNKVQARIRKNNENGNYHSIGGMNRTAQSRTYIFSGKLQCECGANMTIAYGSGKNVKYACTNARKRGICSNKQSIRRDRLEEQLLEALAAKLRRPEMLEHAIEGFRKQLEQRAHQAQQEAGVINQAELRKELEEATAKAQNLVEAIAVQRTSPFLSGALARVEARIAEITSILNAPRQTAEMTKYSPDELREFVLRKAESLVELLLGDPKVAKEAIQKHVGKIIMKPKQTDDGPAFEVSGDIDLFGGDASVMLCNPPHGIAEHYTPFLVSFGPVLLAVGPKTPGRKLRSPELLDTLNIDAAVKEDFCKVAVGMRRENPSGTDAEFYVFPVPVAMNNANSSLASTNPA